MPRENGTFPWFRKNKNGGRAIPEESVKPVVRRMEAMALDLKKAVEENEKTREAARVSIEEKEAEINLIKKDLGEQIEKLRKTQGAMALMIKDLNDMSAELKEARDRLEEKVAERTNELMNISQKLHRSEKLAFLGRLAGSVTHELRDPLGILSNAAYCLDQRVKETRDGEAEKLVTTIKKEISIIDNIIEDIMGFAGTRQNRFVEIDIKEVVEDTIARLFIPKLIRVERHFEDLPGIELDPEQIQHALLNIANNAIMAMKGNGVLTFRSHGRESGYVCVEVEDTGVGIKPEDRLLVFEPLYSTKPKGTGLGLSLAKMLVEAHKGRIEFTSEVGKGTTFSVFLPVKGEKNNEKKV